MCPTMEAGLQTLTINPSSGTILSLEDGTKFIHISSSSTDKTPRSRRDSDTTASIKSYQSTPDIPGSFPRPQTEDPSATEPITVGLLFPETGVAISLSCESVYSPRGDLVEPEEGPDVSHWLDEIKLLEGGGHAEGWEGPDARWEDSKPKEKLVLIKKGTDFLDGQAVLEEARFTIDSEEVDVPGKWPDVE